MNEESVFRIVTRGVAVIAMLFALVQVLSLPNDIHRILHYMHALKRPDLSAYGHEQELYLIREDLLNVLLHVVSMSISLWAASVHARAPRGLRSFYGMSDNPS